MRAGGLAALTGVVVLVTGGALLATPEAVLPPVADRAPSTTTLTRQQLLCPAAPTGGLTSTRATGRVRVGLGADAAEVDVARRAVTAVPAGPGGSAYAVDGRGATAPGLVAAVADVRAGSAAACLPPAPDHWFTGVGAASIHASALTLVNPDGSAAVAELEILGVRGDVDAGPIRSVTVPARSATTLDLAAQVPSRSLLAVHVIVVRGRLGAALADRVSDLTTTTEWLPPQAAPARTSVLTGLAGPAGTGADTGTRTLVLANPGEDQTAVTVQAVDADSTFTPTGVEPVEVPARSVVALRLPTALARAVAAGAGLQVGADQPVTATLRTLVGGDLSLAVASPGVIDAGLLLPDRTGVVATLDLAAPEQAATATVTAYDAAGRRLARERAACRRRTLTRLRLPARTSLVTVTTSGPALTGAVRVADGARVTTLPLTGLVTTAEVPAVRPAGYSSGR